METKKLFAKAKEIMHGTASTITGNKKPVCEVCKNLCRYNDDTNQQEVRFCSKKCKRKRHNKKR